jgi:hypothetical protein
MGWIGFFLGKIILEIVGDLECDSEVVTDFPE